MRRLSSSLLIAPPRCWGHRIKEAPKDKERTKLGLDKLEEPEFFEASEASWGPPPWRCGAGFKSELFRRARSGFLFPRARSELGAPSVAMRGGVQIGVVPTISIWLFERENAPKKRGGPKKKGGLGLSWAPHG